MQKKYPYIKIDRQDITKQEKKEKKIKESEGFIIKDSISDVSIRSQKMR